MAIPALDGFEPREKVTAVKLTQHTKGALEASVYYKPFCLMRATSTQTLPTTSTATVMELHAVDEDTDGMADLANNQMIVRTAGLWRITGQMAWNTASGGARYIRLYVGGGTSRSELVIPGVSGAQIRGQAMVYARCTVGQAIQARIAQTSGSDLDTSSAGSYCWLAAEWISL